MKLSILLNTWDRYNQTIEFAEKAILNCGVEKELIVTDQGSTDQRVVDWVRDNADLYHLEHGNMGNPQSFNRMLEMSEGDYIALIANDIKLPLNWAKIAIEHIEQIKNTGLMGYWCVSTFPERVRIDGVIVRQCKKVFGTWIFSREVLEKIGNFRTFSKYGLWDSDYNIRCDYAGLISYYHCDFTSDHMISDVGHNTEYRLAKDRELSKAKIEFDKIEYNKDNYYYHD